MLRRIIAFALSLSLLTPYPCPAQTAANIVPPAFRPAQLRYFLYDAVTDNFRLFLDTGSQKELSGPKAQESARTQLEYFLVGLALPDTSFWVNLRPDSRDQMIDDELGKTDVGRIMLEADLRLKKDAAFFTSPKTKEGKQYWDRLYKKAEELYGSAPESIPTITRPWIVPGEIIIRQSNDSAYIYKALLDVKLEQDHLKNGAFTFADERARALNEYSSQLIRELIIPRLVKEVNAGKNYAALRQVYYGLILSRWFKARFTGKAGTYSRLIDSRNLTGLVSRASWSKAELFNQYRRSFEKGEYDTRESIITPSGQKIRRCFSGGISITEMAESGFIASRRIDPALAAQPGIVGFEGSAKTGTIGLADGGNEVETAMDFIREHWDWTGERLRNAIGTVARMGDDVARREVVALMVDLSRKPYDFDYSDQTQREENWEYARQQESEWQAFAREMIKLVESTPLNAQPQSAKRPEAQVFALGVVSTPVADAKKFIQEWWTAWEGAKDKLRAAVTLVAEQGTAGDRQDIIALMTELKNLPYDFDFAHQSQREDNEQYVREKQDEQERFAREMIDIVNARGQKDGGTRAGNDLEEPMVLVGKKYYRRSAIREEMRQIAKQGDPDAKRKAVEFLGELARMDDTTDWDYPYVLIVNRLFAIEMMRLIGDKSAVPQLREIIRIEMKDKNLGVTRAAIKALQEFGENATVPASELQEAMRSIRERIWLTDEAVFTHAVWLIACYGDDGLRREVTGVMEAYRGENKGDEDVERVANNARIILEDDPNDGVTALDFSGRDGGRAPEKTGGVDFRVLQMNIQPIGSFAGLNLRLPALRLAELSGINVSREVKKLRNMVQSGLEPSAQRVRELVAASIQKKEADSGLLLCVAEMLKIEEANAVESPAELKEALALLDIQG